MTEPQTLQESISALLEQSDPGIPDHLKAYSPESLWCALTESTWWHSIPTNYKAIQGLHYILTQNLHRKLSSDTATNLGEALFQSLQGTQA